MEHIHEPLCAPQQPAQPAKQVYERRFPRGNHITIRSLCLETDIPLIYEWVNQDYAKRFWQMDGRPLGEITMVYEQIMLCDFAQSFIACCNHKPVCQLDVYHAMQDEVSLHYKAHQGDYGIHVLMAPNRTPMPGLSAQVLQAFMEYFFLCPEVERIIGEPDAENARANALVRKLGFRFRKQINMSYKTANLYTCTYTDFTEAIHPKTNKSHAE
jgi:acetyl CoA:N6-hydroxylysine acetyl transferase